MKKVLIGDRFFFFLLFLLSVSGWSACLSVTDQNMQFYQESFYCGWSLANAREVNTCTTVANGMVFYEGGYNYVQSLGTPYSVCVNVGSSVAGCEVPRPHNLSIERGSVRWNGVRCDTQCEADSVACISDSGHWVDYPNSICGKRCVTNACTAEDTTALEQAKSRCDSLGGSNDFALSNAGDRCDLTGFCDLCNGTAYKKIQEALKKRCCELGFLPDTVKCTVADPSSATKEFNLSSVECSPSKPAVKITASGESYREGCDPEPGSSTSTGESSNSNEGSSSSECIGFDCPESSNTNSNPDLEDIKDSLHKIILYDSTTASNTMDLVNYLYDLKTCLEYGTCGGGAPIDYSDTLHALKDTLHHSNELLKQIADKDLSVNVTGGLTAEKQAELVNNIEYVADSAAKYGIVNGEKLDSIVSALHQLGADTLAHRLDSMRNGILQDMADSLATVGGWLAGFDSIFSKWGDTTGAVAAGDTSGKGGELDALGDSLAGAVWGYPCDTTGGKTCDDAYIGTNGLENAKSAWRGAADDLGDSLQSGAVNDSVTSWRNKLINNGVLSGNGSATCPAVFNRTWQIPIGRGSSYTFGPLGTMVCHDFGFGLTFWALARILLRAMVAISCMWWLYRAVTGTEGGNNDED